MNLLDIIERDGLKLKKVGTEYQGPCPFCQAGTDRFHVHPEKGEHGYWWCRVCGKKGDAIQFLRDHKGMGYREACEYLGQAPKEIERKYKGPRTPTAPPAIDSGRTEECKPRECKEPEEMWKERAEVLVEWGQQILTSGQGSVSSGQLTPLQWLEARGITLETVKRFRLGWNPGENGKDIYRSRSSWGLPEEKNSQGKPKKVWVPRGLIIPYYNSPQPPLNLRGGAEGGGVISRIRIRRPDVKEGEDRFILIPGGYTGPMVINSPQPPLNLKGGAWVIVESELDAILIAQEVGEVVGVMAMGNNIARPDGAAFKLLKESLCILNALDADQGGAVARQWWERNFEQCQRWPVPKAKDPGDYYKEGGNIREWVMAGLPPIFKVSIPSLDKEGQGWSDGGITTPLSPPKTGGELKHHIIEASDGRRVYLTDDPAEYKRLQKEKKIVFNSKELALINPVIAERALDAKEIWKRAEVVPPVEVPAVGAGLVPSRQEGQSQGLPLRKTEPQQQQGGLF